MGVKTRGVFASGDDTNQRVLRQPPGVGLRQPQEWRWEQFGEKNYQSLKTHTYPYPL